MEPSPSPQTRVRYQFEKFGRMVIDGERKSYLKFIMKRSQYETAFSDLPSQTVDNLSSRDGDPAEQYIFRVMGHSVPIRNDRLAESLLTCGIRGYSILLLFYFLGMTDNEIGKLLGESKSKIQRDRNKLTEKLRTAMKE